MLDFFHYTFGSRHWAFGIKIQALVSARRALGIILKDLEGDLTIASDSQSMDRDRLVPCLPEE
jgi:hypothetical protein